MSVRFDTQDEGYAAVGNPPTGTFTVLGWWYPVGTPSAWGALWTSYTDGTNFTTLTVDGTDGTFRTYEAAVNAGGQFVATDATWYRLAVVRTPTLLTLYSGTATGTMLSNSVAVSAIGTPYTFFDIDRSQDTSAEWFNGRIANLKAYSAALNQLEIELELNSWTAVRTTNLVRHHKLQVPETTDYSGNSNTLTGGTGTSTEADPPVGSATPPSPTYVADRGATANATAATTSSVTLTSPTAIAVGDYLIARVAVDNSGTSGAAPGCTVTDPRSNTWTVLGPGLADPGAAAAGATAYLCYARVDTAYQAADALTFNWGGISTTAKAIVVEEWAYIERAAPVAVAAVTNDSVAAASTTAVAVSITPTAAYQLVYTCLATEGIAADTVGVDSDTTNGSWATLTTTASANATATNNQRVAGQCKVVSAGGAQTWNSTITSRDWAAVAVVFSPTQIQPKPSVTNQAALVRAGSW